MIHFESERLIFRDWEPRDLPDFRRMNADSVVMEFFPKTLTAEETDGFVERMKAELRDKGYGLYAVAVKETGEFIGFIGFHEASLGLGFDPFIEIGWRLKKEAWGNGYATEGAKRCLEHGFERLGIKEVYSFTAVINTRSEQVMKKSGMEKLMTFPHPRIDSDHPLCEHVLYHVNSLVIQSGDDCEDEELLSLANKRLDSVSEDKLICMKEVMDLLEIDENEVDNLVETVLIEHEDRT